MSGAKERSNGESSSSLLDLEQADWNLTSDLLSPGESRWHHKTLLSESQRTHQQHSPYKMVNSKELAGQSGVGNFKSKFLESQEDGVSHGSQLIDSVHLTCSETFENESGSGTKQDSAIMLIDKLAANPEENKHLKTPMSESTKFAPNQSKTEAETSSKKSSSKQNSAKLTSGRKRAVMILPSKPVVTGALKSKENNFFTMQPPATAVQKSTTKI